MSSATAAPLFGGTSRSGSTKYLVEFRAGKMQLKSGNMVHPDKRKGLVYVYQADDALMHFCWKDRTSGTLEDDLIIFPDDIEFKKVPQCTTGRVYILKFKSNNRKFFFWMQEPKTDKDDDYCSKVNEYLNNPPQGGNVSSSSGMVDRDLHSVLSNMDQQQLLQLFGNTQQLSSLLGGGRSVTAGTRERIRERLDRGDTRGSSTTTASTTSTTTTTTTSTASETTTAALTTTTTTPAVTAAKTTASTTTTPAATTTTSSTAAASTTSTTASASAPGVDGPIKLSDLHNILQKIILPQAAGATDRPPAAELSTAFNAETLQPILSNSEFLDRLRPFLPNTGEGDLPTADQLKDTVHSPQFQQAMTLFTTALSSGQLGPLMQQFGLGEDAVNAANKGDMESFLKALQKKKDDDKKDDDDGMALD